MHERIDLLTTAGRWLRCTLALACAPDDEPDLVRQRRRRYRDQCAEYIRLRYRLAVCRASTALVRFWRTG
jgi:hypothetical protein